MRQKMIVAIIMTIGVISCFAYERSSLLGGLRQARRGSSISTYSNVKDSGDSYEVGCMREIGGKRCGSKRVEGSLYCYNCKQIVDRERESQLEKSRNEYNKVKQEIDASRRKREQERQQKKDEINRLNASKWNVYFETLKEQHDRVVEKKPAPQYPPDGLGE